MCFRAIPSPIINTSSIHPLRGKVCHILTLSGKEAILLLYLSVILRNIMKKAVITDIVARSNHQIFPGGCIRYAFIPLTVIIVPGIPQMVPATTYKCPLFIRYLYFVKLYFFLISSFSESERLLKYAFQPGQKLICHLQNFPTNDVGFASCFALMGHVEHL